MLKGGLETLECSKTEIFEDLLRLRRVVVLFDEMEDFVRARASKQRTESRTEGAFITSGMLVPLQELREKSWVLFFLGTNLELRSLDDAVTRLGRFDFAERIDYPTVSAQISYINTRLKRPGISEIVTSSLTDYGKELSKKYKANVTFSHLDELAMSCN